MTDEELKSLQAKIYELSKKRSELFEKSGNEINKLTKIVEEEKNKRKFEERKEEELKGMCIYLDTVDRESWCIKYKGGLWMSKNKKTTWSSEGKAHAALKNSLANFNSYIDSRGFYQHLSGGVETYYQYLIDNNLIEFCQLGEIKETRPTNDEWIPCTEEKYPDDSPCIIAYYNESDNAWRFWTYGNCPYGWNILCRSKAYWKKLNAPEI